MEPRDIGEYRLIAQLGRGGMADVFLAVRRGQFGFTKLVVIKRLRDDLATGADDGGFDVLLVDEARVGARLHHPNIVQTFEAGTQAGVPFMAMEYLDGQSLDRVLSLVNRSKTRFPVELALRVAHDVLSALEYAHTLTDFDGTPLCIVHRDVSPHNIFLTYQGEVKLVDFGVAKHAFSSDRTEVGIVKGKLTYMAPEQATHAPLDGRADVFCAGIVLWESLAMRRLFAADSPVATLKKLLHEPIASLSSVRPDVDPALARICERALERDPARRFPSAAAMRAELEAIIGPASVSNAELAAFLQRHFEVERAARGREIQRALTSDRIVDLGRLDQGSASSLSHRSLAFWDVRRPSVTGHTPISVSAQRREAASATSVAMLVLAMAMMLGCVVWAARLAPLGSWSGVRAAAALAAAPDEGAGRPAGPVLRLCGSNTIGAELAPALVEAFLSGKGADAVKRHRGAHTDLTSVTASLHNKQLSVEITAKGSATAFSGLAAGTCDIGMASRAVEDSEADGLIERGLGDVRLPGTEHVIALDGIAVIVHPTNPLRSLDRRALHDIYAGKLRDWSMVGGEPGPIHVFTRDGKSGTFDTFKHLVLGKDPITSQAKLFGENDVLSDAVATDPSAIGFVGLAYTRAAKALPVSEPGASPMLPTQFTVATEGYMLSRRLYLYTLPEPRTPWTTEFVSFALSHRAQEVASASGFVDLGVMTERVTCAAQCTPQYAAAVSGAERISIDFRFRPASDEPDSRATRDLDRLVSFLREHPHARLRLLGFADSVGNAATNQQLSLERAQAIANELTMRGIAISVVEGLGSEMPVASNETESGRQRNRRVEAWVEL